MEDNFDRVKTEKLLNILDDEIEKKCSDIRERKKNALLKRIFFIGCALSLILPVIDVFIGFSIMMYLIPIVIFQAISLIFLVPILLNLDGGINHVERIG